MITVHLFVGDGEYQFVAGGHASTVVCAAMSCLSQTLAASLGVMAEDGDLEHFFEDGVSAVSYVTQNHENKRTADTLFAAVAGGVESMKLGYPDQVEIKYPENFKKLPKLGSHPP